MKIIYTGFFVNNKNLQFAQLEHPVANPHITHLFKPESVKRHWVGKFVKIRVIGYGNDGINEGYLCEIINCPKDIQIDTPHITLSTSKDGKPVDTKNLHFYAITPFEIEGRYGLYTNEGIKFF